MSRPFYLVISKKAMSVAVMISTVFFVIPVSAVVPNDPNYSDQSAVWDQVGAPVAWDYAVGSKRIVVAIIDTGMDTWHEDLRDNLWVNGEEVPDNNRDDDHNGYVDDVYGWNFVEDNNDVRPSVFETKDDKEAVRHGTIVAGIIGAKGNNELGGTGVNWKVSLMTLRAIRSDGGGSFGAVIAAVNYAINNGADVISLSFMGETADTTLLNTLKRAYEKGVIIVAAGGNYDSATGQGNLDKKPVYPGCFDKESGELENWILAVGSISKDDVLSDFSEYGKCIDIMAPGEYIYSTERYSPQYGYPNQFGGPWFGTSFATPIVAGAVALIKSIHPEWSPKEVISHLLRTADSVDSKNPGKVGVLGAGKINLGRAISSALATPVSKGRGSIFFLKNSALWKYDLNKEHEALVRILSGRPVSLSSFSHYNTEQVAVLLERKGNFFLNIYKDNGDFVEEISVPTSVGAGKPVIKFISGSFVLVSNTYNKRTNKTRLTAFSTKNRELTKFDIFGSVSNVSVNEQGMVEILRSLDKRNYLQEFTLKGKKVFDKRLASNIKFLRLTNAEGKKVMVFQRGNSVILSSVNQDGTVVEKKLSGSPKLRWEIKEITMADRTYLFPYALEGGKFAIYDSYLNPVFSIDLPEL